MLQRNDGLNLHVRDQGPESGRPLILSHGFGQTWRSWHNTATQLAESGFRVFTYDSRGHGESDYAEPHRYRTTDFIDDLQRVAGLAATPPIVVGASLGGLTALLAATETPTLSVAALILVDITPRWSDAGLARIQAFMSARPQGFDSLDEVADLIRKHLPARGEGSRKEHLATYLRTGRDGRLHWHWDPALLLMTQDATKLQQRLIRAAKSVTQPVLLISGGRSELIKQSNVTEFLSWVPHAQHVEVAKASHRVAGDDNNDFNDAILNFLPSIPFPKAHDEPQTKIFSRS